MTRHRGLQYGLRAMKGVIDCVVRPPYPNRKGIVEMLKLSQKREAKKANPDHVLDDRIVKALEDQGFPRQIGMRK